MAVSKPSIVAFLYYPSDGRTLQNLIDKIEYLGLNAFISPLHKPDEKDLVEHYHVVLVRPPRRGFEIGTWRGFVHQCQGANDYVLVPNDPCGYIRYLTHLDHPDRQQFTASVQVVGDLDYEYYINPANFKTIKKGHDREQELKEIIGYIATYGIVSYAELVDIVIQQYPEYFDTVVKSHNVLLAYMRSMEYRIHGERKYTEKYEIEDNAI